MRRTFLGAVLALVIFAGGVLGAEQTTQGVVVGYAKNQLVVKVGDKERTIALKRSTHVHYVEGGEIKEVKAKDRPGWLKKGTRIEIVEEDGKVVEINIKK